MILFFSFPFRLVSHLAPPHNRVAQLPPPRPLAPPCHPTSPQLAQHRRRAFLRRRHAVLRRCRRRILRAPRADPRRCLTSLPLLRATPPPQLSSARATAAPPSTSHRAHPASSSHHHHVPSQPHRRTHSPTSPYLLVLPSPLCPTSTVVPHLGRVVPIADRSGERVNSIRRFVRQLVL
jgi:hypothetical protein